jgi:hypothetical protein
VLECWSLGVLESWSLGVLEQWSDGVLELVSGRILICLEADEAPNPKSRHLIRQRHHSITPSLHHSIAPATPDLDLLEMRGSVGA